MATPTPASRPTIVTAEDKTRLEDLCEQRQALAKTRDDAQKSIDDLSTQIGTQLAILGTARLETPRFVAQIVDGERKTLSKTRLLELGVPAATIAAAEEVTRTSSVRVTAKAR
jgi:hypothetical protein